MKKTIFTLLILIFSLEGIGQISYRTRYQKAVFLETFAVSPIFSLSMDHAVNRRMKSFTDIRYGIGFVPGSKNRDRFGWSDNGVSLPLSVTQNFLVNNLKRRIKQRVSLKCKSTPSKISVEWFAEVGAAYTPVFYGISEPRHNFSGIIGLRQQVVFDIPPKPKVVFLKVQYTPKYYKGSFSWNPITGSTNIFGMSLGFSI
ncbi:MAG TPA: hypothetical protein VK175_12325 [Leadbetterella sp.]|nr:hypothetical protein [Leadbetterella sp.]